jgi:hypothetical protein
MADMADQMRVILALIEENTGDRAGRIEVIRRRAEEATQPGLRKLKIRRCG